MLHQGPLNVSRVFVNGPIWEKTQVCDVCAWKKPSERICFYRSILKNKYWRRYLPLNLSSEVLKLLTKTIKIMFWSITRACLLKNPGEPKIALLKGLWRAVRRVITMKNCNQMVVKSSQVSWKSLSSWVQGELLRRAINSLTSKGKPWITQEPLVLHKFQCHLLSSLDNLL